MRVIGQDGRAILVDLERVEGRVEYACVVIGEAVSPPLPLINFLEAGTHDLPVDADEAQRVLAYVRALGRETARPLTG